MLCKTGSYKMADVKGGLTGYRVEHPESILTALRNYSPELLAQIKCLINGTYFYHQTQFL